MGRSYLLLQVPVCWILQLKDCKFPAAAKIGTCLHKKNKIKTSCERFYIAVFFRLAELAIAFLFGCGARYTPLWRGVAGGKFIRPSYLMKATPLPRLDLLYFSLFLYFCGAFLFSLSVPPYALGS